MPGVSTPNYIKAFCTFDGASGTITGNALNVASVTRNSLGNYTVTFKSAFSNANYTVVITGSAPAITNAQSQVIVSKAAGSVNFTTGINSTGLTDFSEVNFVLLRM